MNGDAHHRPPPDAGQPAGLLHRQRKRILDRFSHRVVRDPDMLSLERTRLSHERTLMAWIRTGLSLISFGFAIFGFFQLQPGDPHPFLHGVVGARGFGIAMIVTGLTAIMLAGVQHRLYMQGLRELGLEVPQSVATIVAVLVSFLGLLALITVVFS